MSLPPPPEAGSDPATPSRLDRATQRGQAAQRRARMWLEPGIGVKRWLALFAACTLVGAVGFLHFTWTGPLHFIATRWILYLNNLTSPEVMPLYVVGIGVMALALVGAFTAIVMLNRSMLRGTGTAPETAVDLLYERRTLSRGAKVVAVGGGTGLSNLLSGLKVHTRNITAVVTVADDGGSSGRLRQSLDMVAPGDLTDCYAALSDSPVLARLLLHRFGRGEGLEGHTFGNLLLATLSEERGGLGTAMQDIHDVLRVRGAVFPATTQPTTLVAQLDDGREIRGESQFAALVDPSRIRRVQLDPPGVPALPQVLEAIRDAELIVLGPGSLYTSIIPVLLVPEVSQAIRDSAAPVLYVASLMTEPGETTGLSLEGHVHAVVGHLGRMPDWVLMNSAPIPADVRERYRAEGAEVLNLDGASRDLKDRVRFAPLLQPGAARHDPAALANAIVGLTSRQR